MTPPDWMIINATRYALAHLTHGASETAQWLIENWDELDGVVKSQLRSDIEAELRQDDAAIQEGSTRRSVAMEFDRREWEKVRALWEPSAGREEDRHG